MADTEWVGEWVSLMAVSHHLNAEELAESAPAAVAEWRYSLERSEYEPVPGVAQSVDLFWQQTDRYGLEGYWALRVTGPIRPKAGAAK